MFKSLFFWIVGFSFSFLHAEEPLVPSVLVIGHGFMGQNHVKNLETLAEDELVRIVGIVDTDEKRLEKLPYPTFLSTEEALQAVSADIVVIACNTKEHYDVLKAVLNQPKKPALFIEKPLTETSSQALELKNLLESPDICFTCGYLFRQSPIVQEAIEFIQNHALTVKHIDVRWQKKRVPSRPSAGVHIDEATHPVDLILNQLMPALDLPSYPMTLNCSSRKYSNTIIDKDLQERLYNGQKEKLNPLAEVTFQIHTPTLAIDALSSFLLPPQRREIVLQCSSDTILTLIFDKDQNDLLHITSPTENTKITIEKPNKLLIEWLSFLEYYHTRTRPSEIPSLQDMISDLLITEMMEQVPLEQACTVPAPL